MERKGKVGSQKNGLAVLKAGTLKGFGYPGRLRTKIPSATVPKHARLHVACPYHKGTKIR